MPPRKRLRVSQPGSASPVSQVKTPTPVGEESSPPEQHMLNDPWTDEEETALFKALMRFKPTGIHKHFHLMALHQDLLNDGHIHPRNEHTKPAGIWQKLESLYDLGVLDEREDARQLEIVKIPGAFRADDSGSEQEDSDGDGDDDAYSEAANKIENDDFDLPGDDFAERKWMRRLATDKQRRDESPPLIPDLNLADDAPVRFTPSFSIEPSEVATPTSRKGKARAGTASTKAATARRSTRQAESGADDEDDDDDDEGGDGAEEDGSDEEEDQSEQSTPARRGTRNAKENRSRPDLKKTRSRGRAR